MQKQGAVLYRLLWSLLESIKKIDEQVSVLSAGLAKVTIEDLDSPVVYEQMKIDLEKIDNLLRDRSWLWFKFRLFRTILEIVNR